MTSAVWYGQRRSRRRFGEHWTREESESQREREKGSQRDGERASGGDGDRDRGIERLEEQGWRSLTSNVFFFFIDRQELRPLLLK